MNHAVQDLLNRFYTLQPLYLILFLDIDGTLADFKVDPTQVTILAGNLACLRALVRDQHIGSLARIHVCAVTGRAVKDALPLFEGIKMPILGSYGLEYWSTATCHCQSSFDVVHQDELNEMGQQLIRACQSYPSLTIENKPYSLALHYRACPERREIAQQITSKIVQHYPHWHVKSGKCVEEIIIKQADKGLAIKTYYHRLKLPSGCHALPLFIGDDRADESGFAQVQQLGGHGIKVGCGQTIANYRVADLAEVTQVLEQIQRYVESS